MGCAGSKTEDLPLVALCRERRELIRDAAEHRYALAAAHHSYFRALERVGDALERFAAEELVSALDSPVLTLPPSEGKPLKNKSGGSSPGSNGGNASDYVASSPQSPLSSCVSPFSGSHLDVEFQHPHHPSGSESEKSFDRRCSGGGDDDGRNSFQNSVRLSDFPNANFYYMKSAPTMPSTVYHDPYGEQWSKSQGQAPQSGYGYWYGYPPFAQEGAYYNEPLGPSQREEGHVSADCEEERLPPPPPAPPPPPPSQSSPWDFFNPFDSYEQMLDGYTKSRFVLGSVASSPNSSEVREREGIPDLEEETEQESVKGTGKRTILEDKRVVDDDSERFNSSVGSSEAVIAPHGEKRSAAVLEDLEETKRSRGGVSSIDSCEVEDSDVREEPLRCEGKVTTSRTMEAGERTKDAALSIHRTKDVVEAMKEITEQFKSAACCGEDVSRMLEVDKLKYRPKIRIFKGAKMLKMNEAARIDFEKYVNMQSSNLSSTLEQLYLWEKKLYKEVKDEEKLRVFYDKEYARLKTLDDKGAESNKIDSSRAAINKFINKISMSIKSVDAISRRIHKLRDEELQPQLLELIHGLIRMWRSMLDCHQKQFQAIIEAKSHQFMLKPFAQPSLIAKATLELELELMNWFSCFSNWVKAQRAYVESLNGWLIKWLHEKQEETPDGIAPCPLVELELLPFLSSQTIGSTQWRGYQKMMS
ncbi:hypothetical protein HPP92_000121 [Vanilla planifolia]|uniref:Uncharacterized protein n=1 Tax=Vanilla planifolia TaxID=51239 RepID=A0A835VGQ0_VANPL|nr:hypothetical protein HPP92_000121 [Vanilla planifolia]